MRGTLAGLVAFLAYWLYKDFTRIRNLLLLAELPSAYFAGGDASKTCRRVSALHDNGDHFKYCEDATIWKREDGKNFLIVGCDSGRHDWNTVMGPLKDPNPRGSLWVYDYSTKEGPAQGIPLENYPRQADFHPLGINILSSHSSSSPSHAFIVNHARHNTTIEHFHITPSSQRDQPPRFTYIRTLSHPAFVSPNSVAVIPPASSSPGMLSFYVSNDHRFTRRLPSALRHVVPLIETVLGAPFGWVDRVDISPSMDEKDVDVSMKVRRVISGIPFANGVALSEDGKILAVSSTSTGFVRVYDVVFDGEKGEEAMVLRGQIPVPFSPDNLSFEHGRAEKKEELNLIITGHPHFPSLIKLAKRKARTAPSWVVEVGLSSSSASDSSSSSSDPNVPPITDIDYLAPYPISRRLPLSLLQTSLSRRIKTLYQSDGTHFSSSATGLKDDRDVFVVGLYGEGILHCQGS